MMTDTPAHPLLSGEIVEAANDAALEATPDGRDLPARECVRAALLAALPMIGDAIDDDLRKMAEGAPPSVISAMSAARHRIRALTRSEEG